MIFIKYIRHLWQLRYLYNHLQTEYIITYSQFRQNEVWMKEARVRVQELHGEDWNKEHNRKHKEQRRQALEDHWNKTAHTRTR